jgi:soluble lytic murein transglycosylase
VAWTAALEHSDDLEQRRSLKLAIVASRQRSGELERDADPDQLVAQSFPGSTLPGESPPGARSATMALLAAEELVSRGRGAMAIEAFQEALSGELTPDETRRASKGLGLALFRLRRYQEAIGVFAALGDDPEGRFWHARANARAGQVSVALREFGELAKDAPPEYASRSAYLAATLLEDRGETARAMAYYEQAAGYAAFPERARQALWRLGWSALRRGEHEEARRRFAELAKRHADPLEALRPRYWAARAAELGGDEKRARAELAVIAQGYPLDYYGWRAQQRIGVIDTRARAESPPPGGAKPGYTIAQPALQRAALLLEADLAEGAHRELLPLADRARTLPDRVTVGRMLVSAGDYHRAQRLVVEAYSLPLAQGVRSGQEALFWLSWPPAYRELVEAAVPPESRIEPALVWAIMREESGFRPEVMSSAGAMGLLQLMPETASRMARASGHEGFEAESLFTPETNIALGSVYLDHLVGRFPGRLSAAIGSYNAGPLAVKRWLRGPQAQLDDDVWVEDIPYGQTRSYVKRVLRSLHVYRSFY